MCAHTKIDLSLPLCFQALVLQVQTINDSIRSYNPQLLFEGKSKNLQPSKFTNGLNLHYFPNVTLLSEPEDRSDPPDWMDSIE